MNIKTYPLSRKVIRFNEGEVCLGVDSCFTVNIEPLVQDAVRFVVEDWYGTLGHERRNLPPLEVT